MNISENLAQISSLMQEYQPYKIVLQSIATTHDNVELEGLPVPSKAAFACQLQKDLKVPVVIVCPSDEIAVKLADGLGLYASADTTIARPISTAENLVYTEGATDYDAVGQRVSAIHMMINSAPDIIVTSIHALLQHTLPKSEMAERVLNLEKGSSYDLTDIQRKLLRLGYERAEVVEQSGQWTRKGGIIDIFAIGSDSGVRLDFFGDDLESIRKFDPETQRSIADLDSVSFLPAREMPLHSEKRQEAINHLRSMIASRMEQLRHDNLDGKGDEHAIHLEERVENDLAQLGSGSYFDQAEFYFPHLFPEPCCLLDYLPDNCVILIDEPTLLQAHWNQEEQEMKEIAQARYARGEWLLPSAMTELDFDRFAEVLKIRRVLALTLLSRKLSWMPPTNKIEASAASIQDTFAGRLPALWQMIENWLGSKMRVVFVSRQPARVREILAENNLAPAPNNRLTQGSGSGVYVFEGALAGGFKLPEAGLMVLSDPDIFGAAGQIKKRAAKFKEGLRITSYVELREGDFVVHINHGIGKYMGISKLKAKDGAVRDYLLLQYADGDNVYVPSDQVDRVQKYIGANADSPTVSKLNSGEWQKATRRAKKQVQEMAGELIKLYAARKAATRPPFQSDSPWQHEMEQAFQYEETQDQLRAIEEIKKDMERGHPMDRLICGDVGYGKTEVAMRAAFKAVDGQRQVAVLCPTTILTQQHMNTFRERFAAYPVKVEMVSRFVSPSETRRILEELEHGTVDIVIGTHKLLSKNIKFQNLGLLVVDEEQRFGVKHKERIKQLKAVVDVLTLSATPIPRTLHMSLAGIRDLSLINDPPEGRRPIKTYIKEYDDELVREVIMRELDRKGQIYFVSNRVEGIHHMAERIRKLVPHARVAVGHGQMGEDDLEEVMLGFYHKEFDVLVCTTIIETGLDVSNVNTIVVDNADKLGMSQLYQLRGRVGRSERQGYAYLLTRKDKALTEVAEQRLTALKEFSGLGSGYKVAMRDLEIRGAGNLLGAEQSGTVSEIGFDLYTQLLSQAINELKGETTEPLFVLPTVNLPLDANIPIKYIPAEAERILMYKKLTAVRKKENVDALQEELEDRYGDPPKSVWNLLAIMRLRLRCREIGIGAVTTEKQRIYLRFKGTHLPQDSVKTLSRAFLQYEFATDHVGLTLPDTPAKALNVVEEMVEILVNALPDRSSEQRVGIGPIETHAAAPRKLREQLLAKR